MNLRFLASFFLLSPFSWISPLANANEYSEYFNFKGPITQTDQYPSGAIESVTIYTPPSAVPDRKNAFAVQTIFVSYDVVTYEPRSPITETFIADCSLGTLTTIIRFTAFPDKKVNMQPDEEENARFASLLKKYGGTAVTQIKGLDVVKLNSEDSTWTTPQSIAYNTACKK